MLQSDLNINVSKLEVSAISQYQIDFNNRLLSLGESGPKWWEVGAAKYRVLRREGKTPFPKPIVLAAGKPFSIPSREKGRNIQCRIMMPDGEGPVKGLYMHIHAGGWVLQSEADQDPLLKSIADGAGLAVVSVGYRLSPEVAFPKGPEDCYDAANWLLKNGESYFEAPFKFIGGESAGAHLALLTFFYMLEEQPQFKLAGLVLNFGAYDLSFLPMARNFPKPLLLSYTIMEKFVEAFTPGLSAEQRKDPSISPFYRDLTGLNLPPALFTCGTEDCLLDDTVMMALKWQMTGAETITWLFPGAPHGFVLFPPHKLPAAKECLDVIRQFLSEKLAT